MSKNVYFIGIGGIGMSGVAQLYHSKGYNVRGSNIEENLLTQNLSTLGIDISLEHSPDNINESISLVIISSAIQDDNVELVRAKELGINIINRFSALTNLIDTKNLISITGTHGKTTTTALTGHILKCLGKSPTVVVGGIINDSNNNFIPGSDLTVVEADESDGSFDAIIPYIAIITNIENDHITYYGTLSSLINRIKQYILKVAKNGHVILGGDDNNLYEIYEEIRTQHAEIAKNILLCGLNKKNHVIAEQISIKNDGMQFFIKKSQIIAPTFLSNITHALNIRMYGMHNVNNALMAVSAIELLYELSEYTEQLQTALSSFTGVDRRFSILGEYKGITVINDYAHHPTEIAATINSSEMFIKTKCKNRIIAVVQPHRYSRMRGLFTEFLQALSDKRLYKVIILKTYAADEVADNIHVEEQRSIDLVSSINSVTKKSTAIYVRSNIDIWLELKKDISQGDVFVFMGAGDVAKFAYELMDNLKNNNL